MITLHREGKWDMEEPKCCAKGQCSLSRTEHTDNFFQVQRGWPNYYYETIILLSCCLQQKCCFWNGKVLSISPYWIYMVLILIFQALGPRSSLCFHSQLYQLLTAKSVKLLRGWTLHGTKTSPNASQANWSSAQDLSSAFSSKNRENRVHPIIHATLPGGQQCFICIPPTAANGRLSSGRESLRHFTL